MSQKQLVANPRPDSFLSSQYPIYENKKQQYWKLTFTIIYHCWWSLGHWACRLKLQIPKYKLRLRVSWVWSTCWTESDNSDVILVKANHLAVIHFLPQLQTITTTLRQDPCPSTGSDPGRPDPIKFWPGNLALLPCPDVERPVLEQYLNFLTSAQDGIRMLSIVLAVRGWKSISWDKCNFGRLDWKLLTYGIVQCGIIFDMKLHKVTPISTSWIKF